MELLKPLKIWLDDRYDERRVIRLGLNICGALNGCHQRNIIHRDIKPENILVTDDGRFKLGDFGIAKVSEKTATGTLTGTYSYMAPEIANRQHYGASADIYSLGMVMYWMMNECTLPFLPLSKKIPSGIQRQEAQDRRFSGEPIPAPINGSLELTEIVLKACAFDPQERYHSVQELAEDLKWHYQNLRSGTVRKPKPAHQPTTDDWEQPTIGTGKTYEPPMQEEPPEEERSHWKPLVIAGIAAVLLLGSILAVALVNGVHKFREIAAVPEETIASTDSVEESTFTAVAPTGSESVPSFVYRYEKNRTGITITGYEGELPAEVEIPAEIDGLPVTQIGEKVFYERDRLRSISIPDSVTSIGVEAFYNCAGLSSIIIPDNVATIGKAAFWGCTSLNNITIPDGVTSIGEGAFGECTNLNDIIIPDSVTSLDYSAFLGCTSLSRAVISKNVTSIRDHTFEGCANLSNIEIPDGVTSIGNCAFEGCSSLSSVTIGRKCTVAENAFPDTCLVRKRLRYTYEKNPSGITITGCRDALPAEIQILSSIDGLPVTRIGEEAFSQCTGLSSVTLPDSVTSIGRGAFRDCTNLSNFTIPDSVTYIAQDAFYGLFNDNTPGKCLGMHLKHRCSSG